MGKFSSFWHILGDIGKWVFFRREPKILLALNASMYVTSVLSIADALSSLDSSEDITSKREKYEDAIELWATLMRPVSEEMISNILFRTSIMGIQLKTLLSKFKDLKEFAYFINLAIYSLFGPSSKKLVGKTKYISATESEEKVDTYIIRIKSCPYCYPTMIPSEKLGRHRWGKGFVATIEILTQLAQDFLQHNFQVIAREVMCFHQGDPYGEFRVWLYPREQLELIEVNKYLKLIK